MKENEFIKYSETNPSSFKFRCEDENHPGNFISGKFEIQDEHLKEISCSCFKEDFLWCPHIVGTLLLILKNSQKIKPKENLNEEISGNNSVNQDFYVDYIEYILRARYHDDTILSWAVETIKILFSQKRFLEAFYSLNLILDLIKKNLFANYEKEKMYLMCSELYLKMMTDENVDLDLRMDFKIKLDVQNETSKSFFNFNAANEILSTSWDDPILISLMEGINETNFDSCKENTFTLAIRAKMLKYRLKERESNNILQLIVLLKSRNLIYSKSKLNYLIEIIKPMNSIYSIFIQLKNSSSSGEFNFKELLTLNKCTKYQRRGVPSLVVLSLYSLCKELGKES
jgi:DNA-binding HxlR family transcriptional regulator